MAAAATVAHADSPAQLREGEGSIESKLHVPNGLEPGRYDVYCEARVIENGTARNFVCYSPDGSSPWMLVDAIRKAGRLARFVPATRNGKPAQVYMVLMVRTVIAENSEPLVLVLPNNGVEHARLGLFYIAPQRFNEFTWRWVKYHLPHVRSNKEPNATLIWQELWIDELGNIRDSKLTNASDAPQEIVDTIRRSVDNMQFMPGRVDGKPVAMRYVEPAYSY
jgi:hypothetical protein